MAVTQQDIENLNAAIASGARSVTLGGQTVIYNTTESLIKARDDLLRQMHADAAVTAGKRRPKQSYAVYAGRDY